MSKEGGNEFLLSCVFLPIIKYNGRRSEIMNSINSSRVKETFNRTLGTRDVALMWPKVEEAFKDIEIAWVAWNIDYMEFFVKKNSDNQWVKLDQREVRHIISQILLERFNDQEAGEISLDVIANSLKNKCENSGEHRYPFDIKNFENEIESILRYYIGTIKTGLILSKIMKYMPTTFAHISGDADDKFYVNCNEMDRYYTPKVVTENELRENVLQVLLPIMNEQDANEAAEYIVNFPAQKEKPQL